MKCSRELLARHECYYGAHVVSWRAETDMIGSTRMYIN